MTIDTQEVIRIVRKVEKNIFKTIKTPLLITLIKTYSFILMQELGEYADNEIEEMREFESKCSQRCKH